MPSVIIQKVARHLFDVSLLIFHVCLIGLLLYIEDTFMILILYENSNQNITSIQRFIQASPPNVFFKLYFSKNFIFHCLFY